MLALRPLASTVERQFLISGARSFSSRATKESLPLGTRVSNYGVGFLQKLFNCETVTYRPWKGPKGVTDPKAAEMYQRAEAAATRRNIDLAMEKKQDSTQ